MYGFIERKNHYFRPLPSYPTTVQKNVRIKSGQDTPYVRHNIAREDRLMPLPQSGITRKVF